MNLDVFRDVSKLVELIKDHRLTCPKTLCSPAFEEREGNAVIAYCEELSELPGFKGGRCCCGLDHCPGSP